jgi:hypothetical protein
VIANILTIILTTSTLVFLYNASPNGFIEEPAVVIDKSVCIFFGYLLYFSGLSMFCWMSVMCFDLFCTFGHKNFKVSVPAILCFGRRNFRTKFTTFEQNLRTFEQNLRTFEQNLRTFEQNLRTTFN